ncbi:hypothetical protein D9753_00895 [Streptomyces dangxiongensis]|uniref:Uncharacterized protein n=1 Tax=Streptomyces dangxiongensis TaxID=1442032 RepID=A0A3G2JM18_9ACTN|nr:hypothetical protein D9753_00895 [Streptomyces dangxiongensis]
MWRRRGRTGEQTLTAAPDNPDGEDLYRSRATRADAEEEHRRAAEREARRPVCTRCGEEFTDQRWEETTTPGYAWEAGNPFMCHNCYADYLAGREAAARAARLQGTAPPKPEDDHDQEPGKALRGLFRRRG